MKYKTPYFTILFLIFSSIILAQSIDDLFPQRSMRKDFETFKSIRFKANSGLYKYRTKKQIDSIYNWADKAIGKSSTYRDFYNIICQLTDFEGSLHNDTGLPKRMSKSIKSEQNGYFPYPIKWIDGKWIINYNQGKVPVGSQILTINNKKVEDIIKDLYKYYTTDGINTTGKRIGLTYSFSKYYRMYYGVTNTFTIEFKIPDSKEVNTVAVKSIGYKAYYTNAKNRYSKPFDKLDYTSYKDLGKKYTFKNIDDETSLLTINTFVIGWHGKHPEHKIYMQFLDSIFSTIKTKKVKNLIVDIRHNGGGTDPNDLVTYSYLTNRNFSENKDAWISFKKIPYLKYNSDTNWPYLIKLLGVRKYNKAFQEEFPKMDNGKFYQDETSSDHKIWSPNPNAFTGTVYLLISPRVASAASLFAAMVSGNSNTIVIGEETMGCYYGHNGHTPISYKLPRSKLEISFSVVNLKQDVPLKSNQKHERGIIPDYNIPQTFEDYLNQNDTQMDFALDLIKKAERNE